MVYPLLRKFPHRRTKPVYTTQSLADTKYRTFYKNQLCLRFTSYMGLKKKKNNIIIPPSENSGLSSAPGFRE